jgi:pantoate--beta-alanine ligase
VSETSPELIRQIEPLRKRLKEARALGHTIGLVPTMGALHEGHLSLVRLARQRCDLVVASVFVNPTQFGPNEDFARYPRNLQRDAELLASAGCHVLFAPERETVYPSGHATSVHVGEVTRRWEGASRPGHFDGVATVVLKLLNMVGPDDAYFGQKDYQQTVVIRRMVRDLDVPVAIHVAPTIRDDDGLAMSSRNAYLSPREREQGLVLSRTLRRCCELFESGQRDVAAYDSVIAETFDSEPEVCIDYASVVDADTLEPITRILDRAVVIIAARVGKTRLLDNTILGESDPTPLPPGEDVTQ